jgi:hypothetical protein
MASNDEPWSVGGVTRTPGTGAPAGAEAVEGTQAASGAAAVEPAQQGSVDAVCEALAAGSLDVEAATRELVAQSVAAALGPGADPVVLAQLRAEVEAMLAGDPTLAQLLRGA